MIVEIVEGWTGQLDFQLLADGDPVDLSGMNVEMILTRYDGTVVDTVGDIVVFDELAGKVRYLPDTAELLATASPLQFRFKVTDGTSKTVYYPSRKPDYLGVRRVAV